MDFWLMVLLFKPKLLLHYPVLHDVGKQEKRLSLEPPKDNFFRTQ